MQAHTSVFFRQKRKEKAMRKKEKNRKRKELKRGPPKTEGQKKPGRR